MAQGDSKFLRKTDSGYRAVLPAHLVRLAEQPAMVGAPGQVKLTEPQVEVIRKGDVVEAIQITCTCGKKTVLRCVYAGDAQNPPAQIAKQGEAR
ncbi:MAG: hypothetical protein C4297_04190 [Gemmataceae bacterium]